MLNSLIFSFAMSINPTADVNNEAFIIEEVGTRRDQVRIGTRRDQVRIGTRRDQVRIGTRRDQVRIGTRRDQVRIDDTNHNEVSI
ncbi:hypothetical protein [Colwellia sp. C1TZA3]|uniref:hypothetical protein n=1 Tax=Colwellia sp. C1TZA3 TaxID=2508879 RepID=UPI0011B993B0|nr:hypothetical protein [Colwellia sp. C1TZA3]TWX73092.1 hypothetical protein ESZ39_05600 [Colwellia sp. C1TZA3]